MGASLLAVMLVSRITGAFNSSGIDPIPPVQPPMFPQSDATDDDRGVTLRVVSANFSGTRTVMEMIAELQPGVFPDAIAIVIPFDGIRPGTINGLSAGEDVVLPVGRPATVIFAPLAGASPALALDIRALEVRLQDGTSRRLPGNWTLNVTAPPNLAQELRTEPLSSATRAEASGVTIALVRAARSTTETLVTLSILGISGPGLSQPTIALNGSRFEGALVTSDPANQLYTYTFAATPWQAPVTLRFDQLLAPPEPGVAGYVDVSLDRVLERQGIQGKFGEEAPVARGDQSAAGPGLEVFLIAFARTSADSGVDVVAFEVASTYTDASGFRAELADGSSLRLVASRSSYNINPAGGVAAGRTRLMFAFDSLEALRQPIRLTFGQPSKILSGPWELLLSP